MHSIVTKGMGKNSKMVTQGYSGVTFEAVYIFCKQLIQRIFKRPKYKEDCLP